MNLPNAITLGRLLSVPVLVWLILVRYDQWAFGLFLVAGLSDALDGAIAKRFNQVTALGRLLDPIADKVLLVAVYLTLGHTQQLPIWLVILVVSRDLLIVGGALLANTVGVPLRIHPLAISKLNTLAQIALIALVMAKSALTTGGTLNSAEFVITVVVAATTMLSGLSYLIRWAERLRDYAGDRG